ncbi:hypothetical protein M9H77_06695 [Catharanthus roseus]|uniref:Uncharacterized protein n=1 Tax=Catharanthus roseus TaxID=4058 RepID=A0ACC0BSU5_CATRO|nr:hypothetical protein M9H77_06695 [Catharanthus roseus]
MGQISKEHPILLVYAPSEVPNRNMEKEDENGKETKSQSQSPQFEANQSEPSSSFGSNGKYVFTTSAGTQKEIDVNIPPKVLTQDRMKLRSTSLPVPETLIGDLTIFIPSRALLSPSYQKPFVIRSAHGHVRFRV